MKILLPVLAGMMAFGTVHAAEFSGPPNVPPSVSDKAIIELKFVAVEIQGTRFWLGGGDVDIKSNRGTNRLVLKLLNKSDVEHGFAADALKIRQIVKPGEEVTLSVPLDELDAAVTVYRYYCHLHPGHIGGTGVLVSTPATKAAIPNSSVKSDVAVGKTPAPETEVVKGKLLKIERGFYVIESSPDTELRVSSAIDPQVEEVSRSLIGKWMEAGLTPDLHVKFIKPSTPTYMADGTLVKAEGEVYVLAYPGSKDVQVKVTKDTKIDSGLKIGDRVKTEFNPDGVAIFLQRTFQAETSGRPEKPPNQAQDVMKLDREWIAALVRRDTTVLERAFADDWTVTTSRSELLTKQQYLTDVASGDLSVKSIEVDGAKIRLYGDAAVVTGRYLLNGRYKDRDISGPHRYTNTYVRQQGRWRLVSQDVHAVPAK